MREDKLIAIGKGKPLVLICMLLAISIFASLSVQADSSVVEQRKILSYLEADGEVTNTTYGAYVAWLSADKVIYGSTINSSANSIENSSETSIKHHDDSSYVQIFSIDTNKTEFYRKGLFLGFEDGVISILLKTVTSKNSLVASYRELLRGALGQEVKEIVYKSPPQIKCLTDNESLSRPTSILLLKPEHGCIRVPNSANKLGVWSYFRTDGEKIDLSVSEGDILGGGRWIDWLKLYLMGDFVTMSVSNSRDQIPINTATIKLLSPQGQLKFVEMGEFGLTHARPTRAGMVAAKKRADSGVFVQQKNGLFLWRDGQHYQISEGNVTKT